MKLYAAEGGGYLSWDIEVWNRIAAALNISGEFRLGGSLSVKKFLQRVKEVKEDDLWKFARSEEEYDGSVSYGDWEEMEWQATKNDGPNEDELKIYMQTVLEFAESAKQNGLSSITWESL